LADLFQESDVCFSSDVSFATSALKFIPMAVLGAVIENAVLNLVDIGEFFRAARLAPQSFVVMLVTFLATLLVTIEDGLLYGIVCSVIILLFQLSNVSAA
jgi:sulfate permease, SulP family